MWRLLRGWIVMLVVAWSMAGCAAHVPVAETRQGFAADGMVSTDVVDAEPEDRYQPVPGGRYQLPLDRRENARPAYPSGLLARQLSPIEVVARIVVDGSGRVQRATLVSDASSEPAFGAAVLAAVQGWTFMPLLRVTGDKIEPLPFTQDYRFVFRQVNGRAVVESGVR
jgi:TonB family protein